MDIRKRYFSRKGSSLWEYLDRVSHDRRFCWWKPPEKFAENPEKVLLAVMNLGSWDDLSQLLQEVPEDLLREVFIHAEAGDVNLRSHAFWCIRFFGNPYHIPYPQRKCFNGKEGMRCEIPYFGK